MADREPPYDPYIPSASAPAGGSSGQNGNQRTAVLQAVGFSLFTGLPIAIIATASYGPVVLSLLPSSRC